MNTAIAEKLSKHFHRPLPPQAAHDSLTVTTWLYPVQGGVKQWTFVASFEDVGEYAMARTTKGNRYPRYYTLPMDALKMRGEKPDKGAVLIEMPMALAINKRLIRGALDGRHNKARAA